MKKLLSLLILVSSFAFGQGKLIVRKYIDIPAAPTLTSPYTFLPSAECCGGGIFNYTLMGGVGAGGDGIFSGNYTSGLSLREFDGDATHIYRFVNAAGAIMGGTSAPTQPGISMTNHGNYIYLYGLSALEPMVVKGERGVGGFLPAVGGAYYVLQNIVAKSTTAASFQANSTTSGGSYYASWIQTFTRSFNSGQEAIAYLGRTATGGAPFTYIYLANNFGYSPYRDGLQIEVGDAFTMTKNTVIGAGQGAEPQQINNFQIECNHGTVSYNIFDHGGQHFVIFANGVTISRNYMSADTPGYMGKSDDLANYFNSAGLNSRINGDSIIVEYNYIKNTGVSTYAVEIQESKANIIFRNNTFEGYTDIYYDHRGVHTNTITGAIGDHGNVSASITAPVYVTGYNDPNNYLWQGLIVTSSPYYALHFGYRTP